MRLVLLQDQVHLPSLGGGNKATRLLMEGLVKRGHVCTLVAPALVTRAGPTTIDEFHAAMRQRDVTIVDDGAAFRYAFRGVEVRSIRARMPEAGASDAWRRAIADCIATAEPDCVIVSDDRHQLLVSAALESGAPVLFIAQTVMHMPFGPDAARPSAEQTARLERCRAVMAVGDLRDYVRRHSVLDPVAFSPPVYGDGPFAVLGRQDGELVTLVNPCVEKGVDLFLAMARARPSVQFAAVPTWGADDALIAQLRAEPNVVIVPPADDIDEVLRRTRILLAPSLWPEAFGLIVVEAMLRGIPVLASDIGGLPQAKQGVEFILPVRPAERRDGVFVSPPQDVSPWLDALDVLLGDRARYERCARDSREAAHHYVAGIGVEPVERVVEHMLAQSGLSISTASEPRRRAARAHHQLMPRVAIVDPYSGGAHLAPAFARRGVECVMVQSAPEIPALFRRSFTGEAFGGRVHFDADLDATARALAARDVSAVLAGCDMAVEWADALSERLGVMTNGTRLSAARRDKVLMQDAVASGGLRTMRELATSDVAALIAWADTVGWPVIVKPRRSCGSDSIHLCWTPGSAREAATRILSAPTVLGDANRDVLAQEFIRGDEYVVDIVSRDGVRRPAAFWRYARPPVPRGGGEPFVCYDGMMLLPYAGDVQDALFTYACGVLDALEISNGPAHCEIMLDDRGPVLVEVGARLSGGSNGVITTECGGDSAVELTVDAVLDPVAFKAAADRRPSLMRTAGFFFFRPPVAGRLRALPRVAEIEALPSFQSMRVSARIGEPLGPVAGIVTLMHDASEQVGADIECIRAIHDSDFYVTGESLDAAG